MSDWGRGFLQTPAGAALAERLGRKEGARVATVLSTDETSPDDAAESIRVGKDIGLPPSLVAGDLPLYRKEADQRKTSRLLKDSPRTRKWLSDFENGRVAKDDIETLSWFERNVLKSEGALTRGAGRGVLRLQAMPSEAKARSAARKLADAGKTYDDFLAEELARIGGANAPYFMKANAELRAQERAANVKDIDRSEVLKTGGKALTRAREILDRGEGVERSESGARFQSSLDGAENSIWGFFGAVADDPVGAAAFIAETAVETLPVLVAATGATAMTRSPATGVAVMGGGSFLMENSTSAMEFLAEQGVDLSTPEAAEKVLADTELMAAAADRGLTRGVIIALFDAVSGGVAGQTLMKSAGGEVVVQGLAQALFGSAGEGVAQYASGQEINWHEIVVEGLAELATAPIEVGGVAGRAFIDMVAKSEKAGATATTIEQIDEQAAASKLKKRSPEKFRDALDAQELGDFYVPAESLREYFQAKDTFDDETLEAWGIDPEQFRVSEAAGDDIAVPKSTYAAYISGSEDAEWFRANAVTEAGEMSLTEAQRFNEESREIMERALEEVARNRAKELNERASDVKVYDDVFSQLRAAGRTRDVADMEARVWASFWRTMAERYGGDPLELAQSMGVAIRGPEQQVARSRGDLDIMLNTLRKDKNALKPKGMGVLDFVRSKGGVRDRGGDIAAMDPPKGLVAESREDIQARDSQPSMMPAEKKGLGLDELGRALIEAGYFPEYMGGQNVDADGTVVDEAAIALEALSEAVQGRERYIDGEGPDAGLTALSEALSERGIDLAASNDEIAAALEGDGQSYNQDGTLKTDTPEFKAWFGDSKVVDDSGKPLVVYHGTAADFEAFDSNAGSKHIELPGFYFTPDPSIADNFSASASRKEIRDSDGYIEGYEGAQTIPVYLSIKNPVEIDGSEPAGGMAKTSRIRAKIDAAIAAGHDGAIIRGWRDGSGDVQYVAFSPEQIKSVNNRGTFDPADPRILYQEKRGSIQLPTGGLTEGQTVINLFEQADLSTFIHEAGHYFLEAFTALATADNAPQAMRDDLAVIHKFLEVKSEVNAESPGAATLSVEQHEKWARGFEAYAMEGKAPSLELADAFSRFKAWLTRIYRSIKGLNVKLSPEVREVMDRMLATDEEIRAARETQMLSPLFTDQKAAGMSDAAWSTYQRMARRSEEQASQTLLEKTMARIRRERAKWYKDERKQVRKEVEQTVTSQREHRLVEMLANQKWIGSDRDIPDMQLDRDELVSTFGEGVLAELSRNKLGGKRAIYAKDGVSLLEASEFFGFDSPAQMVKILQNTQKRKDAIEAETDRIMLDRYGDPMNDGSIEEEALAAIHSEQQAQTVASEVRHLAARAGKDTRNLTAKVFRQRARMMLGQMSVKDAVRPDAFLAAERRAAKGAEDAFARVARGKSAGDALAIASKHKEQQLLNHYLYMESRDLAKLVASKREKMRNYSKKSVREKFGEGQPLMDGTSGLDALAQIDGILEGYDFRVRSQKAVANAESLRAFVEQMVEDGRENELAIDPRAMEQANRKHYTRLTVDELRGLFDTIDNLDHIGRRWNKLVEANRKRDLDASANAWAEKIAERFGTGKAGEQQGGVGRFFNLLWRADTMLEDIDGAEMGTGYSEFKQSIDDGLNAEQRMNVAMAEKVERTFSVYSSKELQQMQTPREIPNGNGHLWSKMEVIALALNVGNVEGRNRVLERTVHEERRLTPAQLDATLDTLDKRDWEFVQQLIDDINEYWPQLSEVETRRTGVKPKKVDALPIETKFGTYPGGYYPLKYDPSRSIGAKRDEASLWDQFKASGRGSKTEVFSGMVKSRQKTSGGRTIDYDVTVALQHMRKTIRMITLSEAVDASARILKHKAVETAFMDAGRSDMHSTFRLFLDDLAMGPVYNTDPINSAARFIKNNFTMSRLAFNVKTVALQVTGIGQSAAVIGKRNMLKGYRDYLSRPNEAIADVVAKSSFMAERQTTFQKDIYDQANDLKVSSPLAKRGTKIKNEVGKWGFAPMTKVQFLAVDMPTWVGAYSAEIQRGTDEVGAVRHADRMVARAQGSGLYGDRNAFERGTVSQDTRQSDFVRLWTTLGSYMVTKLNRGYLTGQQGIQGVRDADSASEAFVEGMKAASDLMLLFMFEAIVMGLAHSAMTDEDEPEDVAKYVLKETAIATVAGVPIVSGVANAFQGYGGGGVLASVLEMPANVARQIAQGENDKAARRSIADALGMMTGLPTTQSTRFIEGLVGASSGDGPSAAEMLFGRNPLAN